MDTAAPASPEQPSQQCSQCTHCRVTTAGLEATHQSVLDASKSVGSFIAMHTKHLQGHPAARTLFDAPSEPLIGLAPYFARMCTYSKASPETIVCALVTLRKVTVQHAQVSLTNFNAHRLLITSMMVYAKYYDDHIDSNARWARIAGVPINELNSLEIDFLNLCQFDLHVSTEAFHSCVHELLEFEHESGTAANPPATCSATQPTPWGNSVFIAPSVPCVRKSHCANPVAMNIAVGGSTAAYDPPSRTVSAEAVERSSHDSGSVHSHGSHKGGKRSLAGLISRFKSHHSSHHDSDSNVSRISSSTAEHCLMFHPTPLSPTSSPQTTPRKMARAPSSTSLSSLLHTLSPKAHPTRKSQTGCTGAHQPQLGPK